MSPTALENLGVFDPALNIDSTLFPDPMLLSKSRHPEMREAREQFNDYFDTVRKLVAGSKGDRNTVAWRSAYKLLRFPEIRGTCLGYGAGSTAGSGVGHAMTERLLKTAWEIIQLGIDDPDLFLAMGLFEDDFGPDLIGDMFTNVCFGSLADFNQRIYATLNIPTVRFSEKLANGKTHIGFFPENPLFPGKNIPIILMPKDILQDLPLALNWAGIQTVSEQNAQFRAQLNDDVANLWSKKTLESKSKLKNWALSNDGAFTNLLDMLQGQDGLPYDFAGDKLGEAMWKTIGERISTDHPLNIPRPTDHSEQEIISIVDKILKQFAFLIEKRDLWKELHVSPEKVRIEHSAQRMFYSIAHSYCEANNLDITPEAHAGRGPVDFKFSVGFSKRILVEIKLSTNTQLVHGYEKQLKLYDEAENPFKSYFLIVNVGKMGSKLRRVRVIEDKMKTQGLRTPEIVVVDGTYRDSASKA